MWHAVRLFAIASLVFSLGCVSGPDRATDRERISRARTWAFLRNDPPIDNPGRNETFGSTYRVTSPLRDAMALDADIARYIERALERLGFKHVEREADLYVNFRLILQPRAEMVEGNFSTRYLASLSYSPSYIIESTEITRKDYEDLNLVIDLRERRGRTLWRREVKLRLKAFDSIGLQTRVDDLLERLPRSRGR
jgi:hypothetical protein